MTNMRALLNILLEAQRVASTTLASVINDTVKEFIADPAYTRVASAYDIGSGSCEDFALAVIEKLGGASSPIEMVWSSELADMVPEGPDAEVIRDVLVDFDHALMVCDGRFYDAEAPEGVDRLVDLPYCKRHLARVLGVRK